MKKGSWHMPLLVMAVFIIGAAFTFYAPSAQGSAGGFTSHSSRSSSGSSSSSSSSSHSSSSSSSSSSKSSSSSPSSSSSSNNSSSSSTATNGNQGSNSGIGKAIGWAFFGMFLIPFLVFGGIIALVIFILVRARGSAKRVVVDIESPATVYSDADLTPLKERDPDFSEQALKEKVNNMFIQLQESWTKKDWKPIRPFETDALFNQHSKQLQKFIDSRTTNVVEDIGILDTKIVGLQSDGAYDVLVVFLATRSKDYVMDDQSGKVIEGDPKQEIFMDYLWNLIRKREVTTKIKEGLTASHCPNCGASVSINASGECEFCGSVVISGEHDWVLTSIQLVRQY